MQDVRLIQVYNTIDSETTSDSWLVFFKLQPCIIIPDNLHSNIFVSSLLDSPLDMLYHSVQKVFAPVLLRDVKWSKNIDPKIQTLPSWKRDWEVCSDVTVKREPRFTRIAPQIHPSLVF